VGAEDAADKKFWGQVSGMILLKNPKSVSTMLSMNGKSIMISNVTPFVLRLSKDERRVFQQNQGSDFGFQGTWCKLNQRMIDGGKNG
jgi:hypothetical protein